MKHIKRKLLFSILFLSSIFSTLYITYLIKPVVVSDKAVISFYIYGILL